MKFVSLSLSSFISLLAIVGALLGCSRAVVEGKPLSGSGSKTASSTTSIVKTLSRVEVTAPTSIIPKGTSLNVLATAIYSDGSNADVTSSATWSSANSTIASVSDTVGTKGRALGVNTGSTSLRATFEGMNGALNFNVSAATLVSIAITPSTSTAALGTSQAFIATGTYSDNSTMDLTASGTWSSTNTSVVTVSNIVGSNGVGSTHQVGTSTVQFTFSSITALASFTVTAATLSSIEITPTVQSFAKGTQRQFAATGIYSDNTTADLTSQVAWNSLDSSIASVTSGLVSGNLVGSTSITASFGMKMGSVAISITNATLSSISISPSASNLPEGLSLQFSATGTYSDGTTVDLTNAVTWNSSAPIFATIDNGVGSKGVSIGVSSGTTTISATSGGVNAQTTLTVTAATLASLHVTPTASSIAAGLNQTFTAMGTYSDGTIADLTNSAMWSSSNTSISTISNAAGTKGMALGVGTGTTTISATIGSISSNTTFTVTSASLVSIGITTNNSSLVAGFSQQYTATGFYTDNSTTDLTSNVTWSSSTPAVATISNAAGSRGLGYAFAIGSTTITATLGGVSATTALSVTAATLSSLSVSAASSSIAAGNIQNYTAMGIFSDGSSQDLTNSVTWSSSATSVATISNATGSHGRLTSLVAGTTTVSATLASVSGSSALTVTAATLLSIDVTPSSASIAKGLTQSFVATGLYSDGNTTNITDAVTWSSSNTSVASISNANGSHGLLTTLATGSVSITATLSSVNGSTLFIVSAATLSSIDITPANHSLASGFTSQLTATGIYSDGSSLDLTGTVSWSSSDSSKASVSNAVGSKGLASAHLVGSVTITATSGGVSATTSLSVTAATLSSISVTPSASSLAKGLTLSYTATGIYSDGSNADITNSVTWSTSNSALASVSNVIGTKGLVTGVAAGSVSITATLGLVSSDTTLTVTAATVVTIEVTPNLPSVAAGLTQQFIATGIYTDGTNADLSSMVTWSSSNTSTATISNAAGSKGLASSSATGSTTITATSGTISGSTTLTVSAATLSSISVSAASSSIAAGNIQNYTATGIFSDGSSQDLTNSVTWSSSATSVATISNAAGTKGKLTSSVAGTTIVSATLGLVTGTSGLTVTAATLVSVELTPATSSVAAGFTKQFTATGTYTDGSTADLTSAATWSSSSTAAATISNAVGTKGLATSIAVGATTITASIGGFTPTTTLTVTAATLVSITVTPANSTMLIGVAKQFTATGTYSDGSTQNLTTSVTWAISGTGLASISNAAGTKGRATAIALGTMTVTATLATTVGTTTTTIN